MEMTDEEKHRLRLQELEVLDDKRLQAQQQIELYQALIFRAFNKKVKERIFKKGDLILVVRRPMVMTHKMKGKFQFKWSLPPDKSRRRHAHDANQWQVLEKVLSVIKLTLHLWLKEYLPGSY